MYLSMACLLDLQKPIKSDCTLLLLKFLIISLCNSSATFLLEIIADLFASVAGPTEIVSLNKL